MPPPARDERDLLGGERPDGVVGAQHVDERVERVVTTEGLVGGGDGGVDHRPRVDEVAEVDDARLARGRSRSTSMLPGLTSPWIVESGTSGSAGSIDVS